MKKQLSFVVALIMLLNFFVLSFSAAADSSALNASGNIKVTGSAEIRGDAMVTGGTIAGRDYKFVTGTVFKLKDVKVKVPSLSVSEYSGEVPYFALEKYIESPDPSVFSGSLYNNGSENLTVGHAGEKPDNFVIDQNSYVNNITIKNGLNLNISAAKGQVLIIKASSVDIKGNLNITGEGSVIIYTDELKNSNGGTINKSGSSDNLTIMLTGNTSKKLDNFDKINANVIIPGASVEVSNVDMNGNIYVAGDFVIKNNGVVNGYVFAPASLTSMTGSTRINGKLVTKELSMSGSSVINKGDYSELPGDIGDIVTGGDNGSDPGTDPDPDVEQVTVTAVIPKRMSVRFEGGKVVKNGETFVMPKAGTVKFQMCTNNWDTDSYTDDGQGIAGTKVYSFTHDPKKDNYMRVDTNTYFMAVRFHFNSGDYQKLTGIDNVLSTPLESLSVNLPLGSIIKAKAYIQNNVVATADVFVQTAQDKTISYTDFNWEY